MTQERMDSIEAYKSQIPAHLAMIVCQVLAALYYVVCRVILVGGMNRIILSFYRDVVAMIILIPAAYFIDRWVLFSEQICNPSRENDTEQKSDLLDPAAMGW